MRRWAFNAAAICLAVLSFVLLLAGGPGGMLA
jgi:hypothetical protein